MQAGGSSPNLSPSSPQSALTSTPSGEVLPTSQVPDSSPMSASGLAGSMKTLTLTLLLLLPPPSTLAGTLATSQPLSTTLPSTQGMQAGGSSPNLSPSSPQSALTSTPSGEVLPTSQVPVGSPMSAEQSTASGLAGSMKTLTLTLLLLLLIVIA